MTMIICNECEKDISDKAAACIHCGAPLEVTKESAPTEAEPVSIFAGIRDMNGDGKIDYEDFKLAMLSPD